MAILYVTEFVAIGGTGNFPAAGAMYPAVAEQTVAIGGSSTQSSAFNKNTRLIRVHTDSICCIEIGSNPTAVSQTTARMAANQTEYFSVPDLLNTPLKIAVISTT